MKGEKREDAKSLKGGYMKLSILMWYDIKLSREKQKQRSVGKREEYNWALKQEGR